MNCTSSQKRGLHASLLIPDTKVASRTEIFEQQDGSSSEDDEGLREQGARQMNNLMQQLLMPVDQEEQEAEADENNDEDETKMQQEEFTFRLFSSQPTTQVINISEKDDTADKLAQAAAEYKRQQLEDFDDNDPEFRARINAAVITFEEIMQQSQMPYPAMRYPRRVLHISATTKQDEEEKQQQKEEQIKKRRRKSKKRRDFEKAVKEGRIVLQPNMRDLNTPGGWPGWPGHRNPCAIIKPKNQRPAAAGRGFHQQRKNVKAKRGGQP